MREHHRQGDLLFVATSTRPEIVEPLENGILAEGERTGHLHRILVEDRSRCKVGFTGDGPKRLVIDAIEAIRIAHPEHEKQLWHLPEGDVMTPGFELPGKTTYVMRRQREFVDGIARQVAD